MFGGCPCPRAAPATLQQLSSAVLIEPLVLGANIGLDAMLTPMTAMAMRSGRTPLAILFS
jgi:hypothetical protein